MTENLQYKLQQKGWSQAEINQTIGILNDRHQQNHPGHALGALAPFLYWVALFVAILANFVASLILLPLFIVTDKLVLYFFIAVLAGVSGTLFEVLLKDIEFLDIKHHVVVSVFLPAMAFINVFFILYMARIIDDIIRLELAHNYMTISVVYVIGFMAPYGIGRLKTMRHKSQQDQGSPKSPKPPSSGPSIPPETPTNIPTTPSPTVIPQASL
ncbi:hypothetical protein ACFL0W_04205 [Nanoarchaeota archaeon]